MNLEEARKLAEGVMAAQEETITIGDMKFVVNAEAPPLARCVLELADEVERLEFQKEVLVGMVKDLERALATPTEDEKIINKE
jgi:hypothetical protein